MRPAVFAFALTLFASPALAEAPEPAAIEPVATGPAAPAAAPAAPAPAKWKGFVIATDDKQFVLKLATHLQVDGYVFPGDDAHIGSDQVLVRRFRPGFKATVFGHYDIRWLVDLAESKLTVLDAVIELTHLEWLRLRLGKDKSPHSYDHLQSSSAITFLELGPTALLSGNRDLGLQLYGTIDKGLVDYQLGLFDGVADQVNLEADSDDRFELGGRITFKPFKATGIAALADLALGVTGSWGEAQGTRVDATNLPSYKTNGRATWFRYLATTDLATTVVADGERARIGGHLDWRVGPVGLFGEVLVSSQDVRLGAATSHVSNLAWQAYASVVLTGERSTRSGVEPSAPFDPETGCAGAFELAVRLGRLDIDDAAFDDGLADATKSARALQTMTFGFNWYLNTVIKLQLDYERSTFTGGAATGDRAAEDVIGLRAQASF